MSMPSPFELGRAVSENISGAFKQNRENSAIDDILAQAAASQDPNAIDDIMGQLIRRVAPERQQQAAQLLMNKKSQLTQNRQSQIDQNALKGAGLDPNLAGVTPGLQKNLINQKSSTSPVNPEAQKWAYKEIEKAPALKALTTSIASLRDLNEKGVTGPAAGRVPSFLADKEEDAIRKAIDTEAIQLLNTHKSMFPRGLTQGEFKVLSEKLVGSKNNKEANVAILDTYEKLAGLQQKKLDAVQQAVNQYGFDPMLPFIVSGIQKQFDDQEEQANRELFQMVTGKKPKEESIKPAGLNPQLGKKMSLEEILPL